MMSSFKEINKDTDRDTPLKLDDIVNKYLSKTCKCEQADIYIYLH